MTNNIGFLCFSKNLKDLRDICDSSTQTENQALSFYQSDAREVIFKLEALSRIYKKIYDKKYFKSLQNSFKSIEDQLGKIDFYDGFWIEFSKIKSFPPVLLNHIKQHYFDELKTLESLLKKEDWLNPEGKLKIIENELKELEWLKDEEERVAIAKVIAKQVLKVEDKYKNGALNFETIETGLHEFRRKIRWLSIYAQALGGLIQLKKDDYDQFLKKYLTKDVLKSKFNNLPASHDKIEPIYLSQSAFYALSWMISESGDLKDHGLKLMLLEDLNIKSELADKDELSKIMITISKEKPSGLIEIKEKIQLEADHFMYTDRVLDILIKDLNLD